MSRVLAFGLASVLMFGAGVVVFDSVTALLAMTVAYFAGVLVGAVVIK